MAECDLTRAKQKQKKLTRLVRCLSNTKYFGVGRVFCYVYIGLFVFFLPFSALLLLLLAVAASLVFACSFLCVSYRLAARTPNHQYIASRAIHTLVAIFTVVTYTRDKIVVNIESVVCVPKPLPSAHVHILLLCVFLSFFFYVHRIHMHIWNEEYSPTIVCGECEFQFIG